MTPIEVFISWEDLTPKAQEFIRTVFGDVSAWEENDSPLAIVLKDDETE